MGDGHFQSYQQSHPEEALPSIVHQAMPSFDPATLAQSVAECPEQDKWFVVFRL